MGIFARIVTANRNARTRLHDEKGNFVGWRRLAIHGFPAGVTGILRLLFGYRPQQPWIAYEATAQFEKFLTPGSRVLEFGSGMSTMWYAKRVKQVCAIENCKPWFDKVAKAIADAGLSSRVNYVLAETDHAYCSAMDGDAEGFDLIVVDGDRRDECMRHAVDLLKPGGFLYLDNSDRTAVPWQEEAREAERLLRKFAKEKKQVVHEITDFAPTQLFVNQGLLVAPGAITGLSCSAE